MTKNSFDFEISMFLNMFHTIQEDVSNDKLDSSILNIPKKLAFNDLINVNDKVRTVVENFATNTIKEIAEDYGCKILQTYTGKVCKSPNNEELSFACYYNIKRLEPICNVSEQVARQISEFKIRIANHISSVELRTYYAMDNVKVFHEYMKDLYKSELELYTENIFTTMSDFVSVIEDYPFVVDTFNDIDIEDIKKVKSIAIQGGFER